MKQMDKLERYEEEIRAGKHHHPYAYFALMIVMIVFAVFGFWIKAGLGSTYTDTERTACMWIAIASLLAAAWLFVLFLVAKIGWMDRKVHTSVDDHFLEVKAERVGTFGTTDTTNKWDNN